VYGKVKYVGTKAKDGWNYFICCCIVWLWNLVSHSEQKT
jgi:hypothetical protein